MHEDALLSLDRQLQSHPWSAVVTPQELIGVAHADATKHISFVHEIFNYRESTRNSLKGVLDSIEDTLSNPPFTI